VSGGPKAFRAGKTKKVTAKPNKEKVHPVKSAEGGVLPKAKQFDRVNKTPSLKAEKELVQKTKPIEVGEEKSIEKEKSKKIKPWETKLNPLAGGDRKTEIIQESSPLQSSGPSAKMEAIPEKKVKKDGEYTAKDIYVLKGLEPVRKRPGMYIGSTGIDGLHHLIWEVVDNSIDEAMAGYAKEIAITLLPDNRVTISDDGRGIPVEKHPDTGKSTLETVLTTLHAGGKFGGDAYKVSGGLHGVGVSVVCALSTFMEAQVRRDGGVYQQEYFRGAPKGNVKKIT
jgi:hypothetical protein